MRKAGSSLTRRRGEREEEKRESHKNCTDEKRGRRGKEAELCPERVCEK